MLSRDTRKNSTKETESVINIIATNFRKCFPGKVLWSSTRKYIPVLGILVRFLIKSFHSIAISWHTFNEKKLNFICRKYYDIVNPWAHIYLFIFILVKGKLIRGAGEGVLILLSVKILYQIFQFCLEILSKSLIIFH